MGYLYFNYNVIFEIFHKIAGISIFMLIAIRNINNYFNMDLNYLIVIDSLCILFLFYITITVYTENSKGKK
jgi:hypothetical protein